MDKKKDKNKKGDKAIRTIALVTTILNLIKSVIDVIKSLSD